MANVRRSKVEHVVKDKQLIGIKVTKWNDETFIIPVVDVRRSDEQRRTVNHIIKQGNIQRGSKYMKPSYSVLGRSYN